jgi:hypothetical protein
MFRDAVRRWDAAMGAGDAPVWADVVGLVCAAGLFWRAGMHVVTAVAVPWTDPELAAGHDVTWRSPVADLRGRRAAAGAHLLCALSVGVAWAVWPPAWLAAQSVPLAAWATLQLGVVGVDPLVFVLGRASGRMPFRPGDPGLRESIERVNDAVTGNTNG